MTIEMAIELLGALLLLFLTGLLLRKQAYSTYPVFFSYQVWCLLSTILGLFASALPAEVFLRCYVVSLVVDALFQFGVLIELGLTVARHNRQDPPRWTSIALLLLPGALFLHSLFRWSTPSGISAFGVFYVRLQQALPILLVTFLLVLIWWSRLKGLQWPDLPLQIASGLGAYFLVCLLVAVIHTHQELGDQYHWADVAQSGSYLAVLVVSATNRVIYKLGSSHKMRRPRYACRTSHCFVR